MPDDVLGQRAAFARPGHRNQRGGFALGPFFEMTMKTVDEHQAATAFLDKFQKPVELKLFETRGRKITEQDEIIAEQIHPRDREEFLNRAIVNLLRVIIENQLRFPALIAIKVIVDVACLPARAAIQNQHLALLRQQMQCDFTTVV